MIALAFLAGLILGGCLGLVILAACVAARATER